jgi:hypothetical protein
MDANRDSGRDGASRRDVLGALGTGAVAAVAGCTDGTGPTRRASGKRLVDGTLRLETGTYGTRAFTLADERWLTVAATLSDRSVDVKRDGPAVDVFVLRPNEAARYRAGDPFEYLETVSMPDVVNGSVAGTVPAGEYELLVDNTARGSGAPGDVGFDAVIDLEVTARAERGRESGERGG